MNNYPTLKQMQYLLALAEQKNFRKAAEMCNVSQPTLSAAIKEMENLMSADVLDRSRHKKVVFTPFGEEAIKTAKIILPSLDQLKESAKNLSAPLSGPIRLGLIPTIAPYLLPTILPFLQRSFPNIEWQISEGMSASLVTKMNEGSLDLAIIAFPYDIGDLAHKVFFEEEFICAARKDSFGKKKTLTLSDLEDKKLLLLEDGHCLRDHALSACKLQHKREEKALSATSLQTLIQMVGHGYGITLLPAMMIEAGTMPKDVKLYRFKSPKPTRKIGVIWRKNSPNLLDLKEISNSLNKRLKNR
jgi:LysR family hydrogen peroxide-inducible transcriptional activator